MRCRCFEGICSTDGEAMPGEGRRPLGWTGSAFVLEILNSLYM